MATKSKTKAAAETKRPRGRPAGHVLPPEMRKDCMLRVRVTPGEFDKFDKLGGAGWLRGVLKRARVAA